MNQYLFYKYALVSNINDDQSLYNFPKDIINYIISIIYDFTHVRIFTGLSNMIIITNKAMYGYGKYIFGKSYQELTSIDKINNIKKIAFGIHYLLILYNNGEVYMYGQFNKQKIYDDGIIFEDKMSEMRFIMNNVNNMSAGDRYCIYITNEAELYVHGLCIPTKGKDCYNVNPDCDPIKLNIINVSDVLCVHDDMVIILNNGGVISTKINLENEEDHELGQYINIPAVRQLIYHQNNVVAVTRDNKIFSWEFYRYMTMFSSNVYDIDNVKMIACNEQFTFILTNMGDLYTSANWQSMRGEKPRKYKLTKIDLQNIDSIYCGDTYVIAITENGEIYQLTYINNEHVSIQLKL